MTGRVAGKVALITGAARGQGRSHAVRLAQEGADIIALDLCAQVESAPYRMSTPEDLEQTVKEVEALDRRIVSAQVDVRDYAALSAAVDRGVDRLGRLDIVSANAGIVSYGSLTELPESTWQDMIDINLTGVWHAGKAGATHLIAGGRGGSMIFTSSAAGLQAYPNIGHYVAAKHAIIGLVKTFALELAEHRIRVNTVLPTQVNTPMFVESDQARELFVPGVDHPTFAQFEEASRATNALPIPWVESVDISNAVLFLASDEARYITGAALPVDAGTTIK